MKFTWSSLLFFFLLIAIIVFDAFQHQYYLETFEILGENTQVDLSRLFLHHGVRWFCWALFNIPLAYIAWNIFSNTKVSITQKQWAKIGYAALVGWILSICAISIYSMINETQTFSSKVVADSLAFFAYQKGMAFFTADVMLILALYSKAKNYVIDAQRIELMTLKSDAATSEAQSQIPQLSIKIGNRVKLIPINEVTWIEADDYCVKVHTQTKSYSLRSSLKALEEQLKEHQFIRVHRGALLNFGYLDQVDFDASVVKLQNSSTVPLSRKGAQLLRQTLTASSL